MDIQTPTADDARYSDILGRVTIPVAELIEKPNEMIRRTDSLQGFEDADEMPGKLHWSVGYFTKVPLKKELERPLSDEEKKAAQPAAKSAPAAEMHPYDTAPQPAKDHMPPTPPDIQKTKPDPDYPSGVLSITVHQINNLERQDARAKGISGNREGLAGQDTDEAAEEMGNIPSACE